MKTFLNTLILLVVLVLIGWGLLTIINNQVEDRLPIETSAGLTETLDGDSFAFTTEEGFSGIVSYPKNDADTMTVGIDGSFYTLTQARSASGARYISNNERIEYWEHQGTATLTVDGEVYAIPVLLETSIELFDISPEPVTCTESASAGMCLVVNGEAFNAEIEGFTYQPGIQYRITVSKTELPNPEVGSPYEYRLLEVLNETRVESTEDTMHPSWDLDEDGINDCEKDGTCDDSVDYTEPRPSISPLEAYSWRWVDTTYEDGTIIAPNNDEFIATFTAEGDFSSQTDCNGIFGSYQISEANLRFGTLASTKMACLQETYEEEYVQMIAQVVSYRITVDNELILELLEGGSMRFTQHQEVIQTEV